ncbi:MAG: hypothetical protein WCC21_03860 [Candidatus Acidiferrales bacterium]
MEGRTELRSSRREAYGLFLLVSVLIVLFAGSLRAYRISQRSLWLDEAIAANISRGTLSQTLTLTRDLHSAPIVDPLILYAVEKVGTGPLAVRLPSLAASILSVIVMLCFVTIPTIDYKTAVLSAFMLSISAAQIRYAQEVREYSLSVLYAAALLYVFLSYVSKKEEDNSPIPLYAILFFAPLVQYGLVLFSFGVLSALLILAVTHNKPGRQIGQIITATGFLGLGGLLSLFLTLRYQWGDDAWYLNDYFLAPHSSVVRFVLSNTRQLIGFLLPGFATILISTIAIIVYLVGSIRTRIAPPLAVLACTSCGAVLSCSMLHLYPYGGIRQCLFLAPLLCLLASVSLVQVADRYAGRASAIVFVAIVCVVIASGIHQIRVMKPYAEVENIQQILLTLRAQIQPGDAVYIYPGAVFAVDYYVKPRDPRFIYANYHQQAPEKYVPEMLGGLGPQANRLWLVFSHIYRDEDQRILHDLSKNWNVKSVMSVTGSALYLATPRSAVANAGVVADHTHDNFWDWNIRNSRHPAQ